MKCRSIPSLLLCLVVLAASAQMPAPPAPRPLPRTEGVPVTFGDPVAEVQKRLNTDAIAAPYAISNGGSEPVENGQLQMLVPASGFVLRFDEQGRLLFIRMEKPFSGSVAGVRIGDTAISVIERLGPARPMQRDFSSQKDAASRLLMQRALYQGDLDNPIYHLHRSYTAQFWVRPDQNRVYAIVLSPVPSVPSLLPSGIPICEDAPQMISFRDGIKRCLTDYSFSTRTSPGSGMTVRAAMSRVSRYAVALPLGREDQQCPRVVGLGGISAGPGRPPGDPQQEALARCQEARDARRSGSGCDCQVIVLDGTSALTQQEFHDAAESGLAPKR